MAAPEPFAVGKRVSIMPTILTRMFGRPRGMLGRLGGLIMARVNEGCGAWVTELLKVGPHDRVLEVGFGVGVRLFTAWRSWLLRDVSLVSIHRGRCLTRPALGMPPRSRKACRPAMRVRRGLPFEGICLTRPWRLTPCRSGRTPLLD